MRYSIRLSYNGAAFSGWQIQNNATSVQGCLQKALSVILNDNITVTGAGRTDAKVNAVNYLAHFETSSAIALDAGQLCYKLNAILPEGITVHSMAPVSDSFHARFDARYREYTYFLHRHKDPFIEDFSYLYTFPIDLEKMNSAARYLLGTHDFSCFEKTGGNNATSICSVTSAAWHTYRPTHVELLGYPDSEVVAGHPDREPLEQIIGYPTDDYLYFRIGADRFLRNMVRAVVGSLLEVGRGKQSPAWIGTLIATGTRSDAGESVPGNALFLNKVEY